MIDQSVDARLRLVEEQFKVELRGHQRQALKALAQGKNVIMHSPTGCHAKGQGVLLFDGTIRPVEEIVVGDRLMGPDSSPRTVLRLNRGTGQMYEVRPVKGDPFIVNEDHVLTLVRTGVRRNPDPRHGKADLGGEVVDVRLGDWLGWSRSQQHIHKLFRVGVEFHSEAALPVDPYMLGVLLGDGSLLSTPCVTAAEPELVCAVQEEAAGRGLKTRRSGELSYFITSGLRPGRAGGSNTLLTDIKALGLYGKRCEDKFVPHAYRTATRESRLATLAGLLDTDGSLGHGYDFISKSKRLADDVAFLARSVGLAAYVRTCQKSDQNGTVGIYHRVSISGDLSVVPCRVERKKASLRKQPKNVLRTGFSVEPVGQGDYYGFTLDGDGRYLLDDFTVTHNSGKSLVFQGAPTVLPNSGVTVILYPLRSLVKDQTRRAESLGLPSATLYGETKPKDRPKIYDRLASGAAKLLLTTPESFDRNRKLQAILKERGVNLLVVDEAHAYEEWADGFRPTYRHAGHVAEKIGVHQFLLCSATLTVEGFRTARDTLKRTDWAIVQVPAVRPNLIYRNLSEPEDEILCRAVAGKGLAAPGICFFTTIKELDKMAAQVLKDTGKKVLKYHGSMQPKARREAQDAFMSGDHWIFATKAFGMGIDKANIRSIIHWQLPSSILSYAQECGRAGRDGEESNCLLTQEETGQAASFLLDVSLPSIDLCRKVWNVLQEIRLESSSPWFEVDWDRVSKQTRVLPQTLQGAVSWLFTGKMIEKKQKPVNWRITLDAEADQKAASYKRSAPEIVEALRAEAMVDGYGTFEMRPDELQEIVGSFVNDWRTKLRKLAELDIIRIEEPPAGKSRYRFLHNEFYFAEGEEQLMRARNKAFKRLAQMQKLQAAPAHKRQELIEEAISLNVDKLSDTEEVEVLGMEASDNANEDPIPF